MGRSLSLAAYRALSLRKSQPSGHSDFERPDCEIVWAHATGPARFSALCDLGARLKSMRPDLGLLVTLEESRGEPSPEMASRCDWVEVLTSDHPASANAFLEKWSPDLCLWAGGDLMPNLIAATAEQDIPMVLLDIGESDFPTRRHKWFPDLTRSVLDCFEAIMTNTETAAQVLRRIGVVDSKISVAAKLQNSVVPPTCSDEELSSIGESIAGRPVWLAAQTQGAEFEPVLTAHRTALRFSHRLLLIIHFDDASDKPALVSRLSEAKLRFADWDEGENIGDNTQVLLSQEADDLGLWYRVAPLTFMADSLHAGAAGRSPLEASALGSAILYGPGTKNHQESYDRLAAAGAARMVPGGEDLASAVIQLIAPDQAAAMALAGWVVATEGAKLTDALIDLVLDLLDRRGATHATP